MVAGVCVGVMLADSGVNVGHDGNIFGSIADKTHRTEFTACHKKVLTTAVKMKFIGKTEIVKTAVDRTEQHGV